MATKRDLVEAHGFSRRRLITAFVSGAPGGREVEPVKPGRAIIGGIALAVLLIAGAAIAGIFKPPTPADWRKTGLVVSEEYGTQYVILEDDAPPHPVTNNVSIRLLLGQDLTSTKVKQAEIDAEADEQTLGIFGAPQNLPGADQLISTGWSACLSSRNAMSVTVSEDPAVQRVSDGVVAVRMGKRYFLVVSTPKGAQRLELPTRPGPRNSLLNLVGISQPEILRARGHEWLNLFPQGDPLVKETFLPDAGRIGKSSSLPGVAIGDVVESGGRSYVMTDDGPVALSPFALEVYQVLWKPGKAKSLSGIPQLADQQFEAWPEQVPSSLPVDDDGDGVLVACALLDAEADRASRTWIGVNPSGDAAPGDERNAKDAHVASGHAAYVKSGGVGDTSGGQPWVIDAYGTRYPLGGPGDTTAELLGYGDYDVPTISGAWMEVFDDCGPELSQAAAAQPPDAGQEKRAC